MKKIRSSKKGFTLAELLIVVAIIGVLVGISIPIFSAQLRKSKVATNQANARAAKAAAVAAYLDSEKTATTWYEYDVATGTITDKGATAVTHVDSDSDNVADKIGVQVEYTPASGSGTSAVAEKTAVKVDMTDSSAIYWE